MNKIVLPLSKNPTILVGGKEIPSFSFSINGNAIITFKLNESEIDEMVEWIFKNTTGRFYAYGTTKIYFENEEDAIAFKLRFT